MTSSPNSRHGWRCVAYCDTSGESAGGHDQLTKASVAESIASLLGVDYEGTVALSDDLGSTRYIVPSDTLLGSSEIIRLGIAGDEGFFGGVAPTPFVATKAITHRLVPRGSQAPHGWSSSFGDLVDAVVLQGFTVFTVEDARRAALDLLKGGQVRIKEAAAKGGSGQYVVRTGAELESLLRRLGDQVLQVDGWVVEQNLLDVTTKSIGQVRVGTSLASYYGNQRTTHNHHGAEVYAGSDLRVVRGDLSCLLQTDMDVPTRRAVEQALVYDRAAMQCFPGLLASRRNYDVVQGLDADGAWQSGVLEQSWRIGGASGAEIAALQAFAERPDITWVRASTHEIYLGDDSLECAPCGATIHFNGTDPRAGRMLKYAQVDEHGHD